MISNILFIVAIAAIFIDNTIEQLCLFMPEYDKPIILRFHFWGYFFHLL